MLVIKKKKKIVKWVIAIVALISIVNISTKGMNDEIPVDEQEYIDDLLGRISVNSSKTDVIEILGNPTKDLGLKINWKIDINGEVTRVVVYFNVVTGNAKSIAFDGGPGRYYYGKDL